MRLIIIYVWLLFFSVCNVFGNSFSNEKRSEYLTTIAKYVTWPSVIDAPLFSVGILCGDSTEYLDLQQHLLNATIKGKKISVQFFTSFHSLSPVDLLYFNVEDSINATDVFNHPSCIKTLLVTENYPFQKSMFNFIVVDGKRKFEINNYWLELRGFSVDPLFSAMAVLNKADWETLYQKTEFKLAQEHKKVVAQKEMLSTQELQLQLQLQNILLQKSQIDSQQHYIDVQVIALSELNKKVCHTKDELHKKELEIEKRKALIIAQKREGILISQQAQEQRNLLKDLDIQVKEQQSEMLDQLDAIERQRLIIGLFALLSVLVCISAIQLFRAYRLKQRSNVALQEKNVYILNQNVEISLQRDKISEQKTEITDSIQYASKIQSALLPSINVILSAGYDFFVLYKPRDIVSGDFYWISKKDNYLFFAGADCTGHGVPGGFMSMLGITFLNEIVNQDNVIDTGEILTKLRESIVNALNKNTTDVSRKDGMDIGLCRIDTESNIVQFSGGYNHCFLIRNKELMILSADKMPVGLSDLMSTPFSATEMQLLANDSLYLYSDGYSDQFGGPKGKKFMSKRLKQLLVDINDYPLTIQKEMLDQSFTDWKGSHEQIDDVLIMGLKV